MQGCFHLAFWSGTQKNIHMKLKVLHLQCKSEIFHQPTLVI